LRPTESLLKKVRAEGNGETNSPGAEGAQTQFQSGNEFAPFDRTDLTTAEETQEAPAVQRERGTVRQGEEDDTLDWAAVVTAHAEDRAEDMDQSTDNLSEMEEDQGRHRRT
jgi:hypothetical protein